jgi:predicted AAA+ superfamily ATPase
MGGVFMYRVLEKELLLWKNKQEHLPILLRGARQVGKSFLVEKFGKTYFENIAIIDFEYRPELKQPFIESREPKETLIHYEIFGCLPKKHLNFSSLLLLLI